MLNTLNDSEWESLLHRIKIQKCTPFIGAGACFPLLPLGADIALKWAREYSYPLKDSTNLARVAQFLAVNRDPMFPKEQLLKEFQNASLPDFSDPDEPHRVLADLPLPVYMTTNYDEFMFLALKSRYKDPKRELCRWNRLLQEQHPVFEANYSPTPANPVVFHLHGHDKVPESLVLTEDDYLDFLSNMSSQEEILPLPLKRALAADSLLFIGYSLMDWNFRVIIRGLRTVGRLSVAVLYPPDGPESEKEKVRNYLERYYERFEISLRIYWGTAREFAAELRERYEIFSANN